MPEVFTLLYPTYLSHRSARKNILRMPKAKRAAVSKKKMETRSKSAAKGKDATSSENTPKRKPTPKAKKGARSKADEEPKIRVFIPKTSRRPPFFFSTNPDSEGGFLSPWYPCPLKCGSRSYISAGHLITVYRAELARDTVCMLGTYHRYNSITNLSQESYEKLLVATSEEEIKALAENIKDFAIERLANCMFFPSPHIDTVNSVCMMSQGDSQQIQIIKTTSTLPMSRNFSAASRARIS